MQVSGDESQLCNLTFLMTWNPNVCREHDL